MWLVCNDGRVCCQVAAARAKFVLSPSVRRDGLKNVWSVKGETIVPNQLFANFFRLNKLIVCVVIKVFFFTFAATKPKVSLKFERAREGRLCLWSRAKVNSGAMSNCQPAKCVQPCRFRCLLFRVINVCRPCWIVRPRFRSISRIVRSKIDRSDWKWPKGSKLICLHQSMIALCWLRNSCLRETLFWWSPDNHIIVFVFLFDRSAANFNKLKKIQQPIIS